MVDNAIYRINHFPADSVVCFVNSYSLDSVYPVDSVIQSSNNCSLLNLETTRFHEGFCQTELFCYSDSVIQIRAVFH